MPSPDPAGALRRELGLADAVPVGLGAMLVAGVFAAFGPAAAALTAVNYRGVAKTAAATRVLVAVTLAVLGVVVLGSLAGGVTDSARLLPLTGRGGYGVLQAAGLLFFAFAGYARIATLGEEVRDPARTIRRAVPLALGTVVVLYALVGVSLLLVLGAGGIASSDAPLQAAVRAGSLHVLAPLVRVGAVAASLGVLLSAMAGVGRTTLAMARDRELPGVLAAVHPRFAVPHRAELLLGLVVVAVVSVADIRGRSACPAPACSSTTASPTPARGRCQGGLDVGDGPSRRWDCSAAWCC